MIFLIDILLLAMKLELNFLNNVSSTSFIKSETLPKGLINQIFWKRFFFVQKFPNRD